MNSRWSTIILLLGMIVGVFICIWIIAKGGTTSSEGLLLSVVLTILSIIGSWIASRFYAEESFNKNLRIFALKAAEKVTNLSNELDRLSVFLQQELKSTEYESPSQSLLAKDLRIEGAVHILHTLKSVNDKSLSDWQGVIGEEIIAQREEQEEREEYLRELLARFESIDTPRLGDSILGQLEGPDTVRSDLEAIKPIYARWPLK